MLETVGGEDSVMDQSSVSCSKSEICSYMGEVCSCACTEKHRPLHGRCAVKCSALD